MPTVIGAAPGVIASGVHKKSLVFPLSIPWHSAFWASDPDWVAPASGSPVASWRNAGTSGIAAAQATGTAQPTYRLTYANLNAKPAVEFDGTSDFLQAATPLIAQPNHIVGVGWQDSTGPTNKDLIDGVQNRHYVRLDTDGSAFMFAGGWVGAGGASRPGAPFVVSALFDGSACQYRMNGTAYTMSGSVGAQGSQGLFIGGGYSGSGTFKGAIAFLGVSDTALTVQQVTDLETWAHNYYGVPIP